MEKERRTRLIAIIALCISVFGLSIGFAAFTRDLNIQFSDTNVNISGDLDVRILASRNPDDDSFIIEESNYGDNYATISSDRTMISGVEATFTDKKQYVQYNVYIYNASEYDVYLKSVDFLNYLGSDTNKVCTAMEGTNQDMVDAACEDIHVGIFDEIFQIFDIGMNNISSVYIASGAVIDVQVIVMYADEEMSQEYGFTSDGTSLLPNGDFKVNFGDIKFNFSSIEG